MNPARIQLLVAVLLSISIHASAALMGDLEIGKARQKIASLSVNIAMPASPEGRSARVSEKSSAKSRAETKSSALEKTSIENNPLQKSIINLDKLAAETIEKVRIERPEGKPVSASAVAILENEFKTVPRSTTQIDRQISVEKKADSTGKRKATEIVKNLTTDQQKKQPAESQASKVIDKADTGEKIDDSGDQIQSPPESAQDLPDISKVVSKQQTLSKPLQNSALASDKKTEMTASISSKSTSGIVSKPDKTAIPLYHLIPKPVYPSRSRDLGEAGTVILAILVGNDGSVARTYVSKSSGFILLDASALDTVKSKWRFKPATSNGEPVASWVRVPIKFSLR